MTETVTQRVAEFAICGGTLRAYWSFEAGPLEAVAGRNRPGGRFWVELERDGTVAQIETHDDLFRVLLALDCDLSAEVARVAAPFAEVLALLANIGRSLGSPRLYDWLDERLGFHVRDHLPRVEHGTLVFLVGDFRSGTRAARVSRIRVDLQNGRITLNAIH